MKRIYLQFIFLLIVVFGFTGAASAQSLAVTFNPDPLFSVANALPGDAVMPYATISQDTGSGQDIYIGVNNVNDADGLGSVVDLEITDHDSSAVLWTGTFADLFATDQHFLFNLSSGDNRQLDFDANFRSGSGNEYQNSTVLFDIWLGFDGGNEGGGGGGTSGGGGGSTGGGGGGGTSTSGTTFFIFNENLDSVSQNSPTSYDVTISWDSNLPGTTKIVYGPDTGNPYTLNLGDANFGYPNGTAETDLGGVVDHTVLLPGLTPGTYRYRVVSYYNGQPTTSNEFQFTVGGGITPQVLGVTFEPGNGGTGPTLFGPSGVLGEVFAAELEPGELPIDTDPDPMVTTTVKDQQSPVPDESDGRCLRTWILIILGIIFLTRLIDSFRSRDNLTKPQVLARRLVTSILLALAAILVLFIVSYLCPMPFVAIYVGIMVIWWGINKGKQ